MNDDLLLVTFRANADKYQRDVDRARTYGGKRFRQMQQDAEKASSGIDTAMGTAFKTLGTLGKGLLGGVAGAALGGFSLGAVIANVNDLAKGVAEVGDMAKMAGVKVRDFQELKFVAEQNRIPIDALTDAMKELSLRSDEWIKTGSGSAAESFQRMGYTARELATRLRDPKELLLDIIDRMHALDSAGRIRVFDEVFGGQGGEKFVQMIDRGADGIRKTIKEANDLGIVMDEKLIERADEFNRKWSAVGTTISTYVKQAVLGLSFAADDFLDSWNKVEEQTTRNVTSALTSIYGKLDAAKQHLEDLQKVSIGTPADVMNINDAQKEVARLTAEAMRLRDILDRRSGYDENFIYGAGKDAKNATPPINFLNQALQGTSNATKSAVAGIKGYTDAIRALKEEVPELAASLKALDDKGRVEAIYQKAIAGAQGQREIALANEMRGKALSSLNLKSATDDPSTYLSAILAKGKGPGSITGMQSAFREKLAKMIASMPDDMKGMVTVNSGFRDIAHQQREWLKALKKYGSPEAARKYVAPPGKSQHNKGNAADLGYGSGAAREWMHANAEKFGLSIPMSYEPWHIEDADARQKQTADEIDKLTAAAKRQADAYKHITGSANEFTTMQGVEQQALGMTAQRAAALRYEQEMLNDAQRAGIRLTPQQRQEIAALAQGMAAAEVSVDSLRQKQQDAADTARFFGEGMTDALTGIITGTMTAQEALQQLLQTLIKATLQAVLMGEGPLASLFGTGKKAGSGGVGFGGIFGGLLGALFGFAEGGHVRGPGTGTSDSIPAKLSNGEFVVNAKATKKNRAVLEAINSGRVAAFAAGGYAGDAPALRKPDLVAANSNSAAPSGSPVNINTNVTVNASGGTPEQNTDLAGKVGKQIEQQMRTVVADEIRKQTKIGNYLNQRGR